MTGMLSKKDAIEIAVSEMLKVGGKAPTFDDRKIYIENMDVLKVSDLETLNWCSCFVNHCAMMAGKKASNSLVARSWLKEGQKCAKPIFGDVIVFYRDDPNSWKGHVGFFVFKNANYYYILGGNQAKTICISPFPKYRVLGIRRLQDDPHNPYGY